MAEAILSVSNTQVHRLIQHGTLRSERKMVNLADILERYKQLLRTSGAIEEKVEAVCVRAFEEGLLPQEVIVKFSFGIEQVHDAWKRWQALRADPAIAEKLRERSAGKEAEDRSRCRACLRTPKISDEDTLRIVRDVTGEPARQTLTLAEERALADLDVRCTTCRAIKVTVSLDVMRARIRTLRIMGEPKPITFDPLPATPATPETVIIHDTPAKPSES